MKNTQTTSREEWLDFAETLRGGTLNTAGQGLQTVAAELQRPECVLTHSSGRIFVSDRRGGVTSIWPDGRQQLIGQSTLLPNGIAMERDGSFLIANLGPDGGVWRIAPNGQESPWMTEVDGQGIDRVNFVSNDAEGRVWACISATDGGDKYPLRSASGSIILRDASGTRVVADGLHYTNECRVSADGQFMYVNETFGRRLSRFRIADNGELKDRETMATFGDGDFPDGLTLDAEGGAWVVCVGSNRVYRIAPDGEKQTIIDDAVTATAAQLEAAFDAGTLDRTQLSAARGHRLSNVTSLAFGGPDLRTAYMGCLAGSSLVSFRTPVAGLAPVHWNW
jgi:sugar lactone lactonase YvrE